MSRCRSIQIAVDPVRTFSNCCPVLSRNLQRSEKFTLFSTGCPLMIASFHAIRTKTELDSAFVSHRTSGFPSDLGNSESVLVVKLLAGECPAKPPLG